MQSDTRPYRARTILVYLSDVEEGGHTIFPLCHGGKRLAAGSPEAEVNETLAGGIQGLWGGPSEGFSRHVDFDYNDDHPFNDVFSAAVSGERVWSSPRFSSREGT